MAWHSLAGGSVIGCGGGGGCDQVLSSRWSTIGGVLPVSGLAAGTYLAILLASFFVGPRTPPADRRLAWGAMLVLVGAAAGSAMWFILVQHRLIGAFCPYCIATHLTGLLLAALVVWKAPMQFVEGSATDPNPGVAPRRLIRRAPAIGMAIVGVVLAGGLALSQVALAPPPAYRAGESPAAGLPALDPHAVPLVGSLDAAHIVILQFDYKCPHCQKIHAMLQDVIRRYNGRLAFAVCPAPLSNHCNPYIARSVEEFKDSCELVRIALALWTVNREAFATFDNWMFWNDPAERWRARTLEASRAKAIELVGETKLDAALADPWVDGFMQTSLRIYGQTLGSDQRGNAVPKLVFGSRWVTPEPADADELVLILQNSLGVPNQ
jgi:uncharacterized membrane protein